MENPVPAAHTALSPPKGGPSPLTVVRPPVPSPSSAGRCGSQMMLPAPVALPVPVRGRASLIPHADGAGGFLERGWHLPGGPSLSQVTGAWGRRCRRCRMVGGGEVNPNLCLPGCLGQQGQRDKCGSGGAWGAPTSRGAHAREENAGVKEKLGHIPLIVCVNGTLCTFYLPSYRADVESV